MGTTNWDLFYISTHSLTRRLTLYPVLIIPHKDYFNSQPHKEADCSGSHVGTDQNYFNSQPHKEADEIVHYNLARLMYFNSQPHKEADHVGQQQTPGSMTFQLTASQGG